MNLPSSFRSFWSRLRERRPWGISILAWWLILQGGLILLSFSYSLVAGLPSMMLLVSGVVPVMAGMGLRTRTAQGWWWAIFLFAIELAFFLSAQLDTLMNFFTHRAPVYFDTWIFFTGLLFTAGPVLYLTRPRVREHFY